MKDIKSELTNKKLTISFLDASIDESLAGNIQELIGRIKEGENRTVEAVNFVLTNDEYLLFLNKQFAGKEAVTDVLAFDLSDADQSSIEGDVYISFERAKAQSVENGVSLNNEILRLAAHGFLHLCGYDHDDDVSLREMTALGDKYIDESYREL